MTVLCFDQLQFNNFDHLRIFMLVGTEFAYYYVLSQSLIRLNCIMFRSRIS